MSRRPTSDPRDQDERFKTTGCVSRVLTAQAESEGIAKQELVHRIVSAWAQRQVDAARLLIAVADGEGMPGHGGD